MILFEVKFFTKLYKDFCVFEQVESVMLCVSLLPLASVTRGADTDSSPPQILWV